MKKQRKHTRRGGYYRALATGYAALNAQNRACIFRGTADYFDGKDPPHDQVAETDKVRTDERSKDDDRSG